MIWENVHVLWMIRGKGTCALDDKGRYNNRVEKTKQHKLTEDGHVVGRLAAVLGVVVVLRRHGVVHPLPVLVPDDGGERVAPVGLAHQRHGLTHPDGFALRVPQDLRSLRRI